MEFLADNISLHMSGFNIIRDVNVAINTGQITVIVGPNGAGKSSFIKVLSGDILPTQGQVILNDKALSDWSPDQRARMVSVLPQHSSLNFPFNASEVVALGRIPHQSGKVRDTHIVKEALTAVDANYLESRFFNQMSGGEKQRVQLARVLAQIWESTTTGNQFLVLDEPTSALDLSHQVLTLKIVSELAERGVGVVMVVHDLNLAARCADNIIVFDKGTIVAQGSPDEVLNEQLISDVFGITPLILKHPVTGKPLVVN